MPTGAKKILGFLREETSPKPFLDRTECTEVCRVEVYNTTDNWVQLIGSLPVSGSPGTLAFNPQQITFTFGTSFHPLTNNLYLQAAPGIKKFSPTFWDITLQYSNAQYDLQPAGQSQNPKNRQDQKLANPLSRPPVWTSSSNVVLQETMTKGPNPIAGVVGDPIIHANNLPLTNPYMKDEVHIVHTFSFNRNYSTFDFNTDIKPYLGKVSTSIIFGAAINEQYKMTSCTCSEEYESVGQGNTYTLYHFIRITVSFEHNPSGWIRDGKLVSKSTQQLIAITGKLQPIEINDKGAKAYEPWPLLVGGAAAPYDALNPANYAVLDTGYPETANLSTFTTEYNLIVP